MMTLRRRTIRLDRRDGANFDPEVFPNPKDVDFGRPRKTFLAFTVGVHSCMGDHLARLELKVTLQECLKRIPKFSVRPGAQITYKPGGATSSSARPGWCAAG